MRPWLFKDHGWWCAQRRPLQAIENVQVLLTSFSWTMVVDDDTYVRLDRLQPALRNRAEQLQRNPFMLGATARSTVLGGAGYVLSRALLLEKLSGIPDCITRKSTGDWCKWHSDWAITECFVPEWAANHTRHFQDTIVKWNESHVPSDNPPSMVI